MVKWADDSVGADTFVAQVRATIDLDSKYKRRWCAENDDGTAGDTGDTAFAENRRQGYVRRTT